MAGVAEASTPILVKTIHHGVFKTGSTDRHDHHELVCITQGNYTVTTSRGTWHAVPGNVICYPAGEPHQVELDAESEDQTVVLAWHGSEPPPLAMVHDVSGRILASLHWMLDLWPAADRAAEATLGHLLAAVLHEVGRLAAGVAAQGGMVRRLVALMRADLHRRLTVQEMAEVAGMTRSHFCRRFTAATGNSPQRHLQRLRVEAALNLIGSTTWSLQVIARRCGLANAAHLSRLVLAQTGRRPSSFRAAVADGGGVAGATAMPFTLPQP